MTERKRKIQKITGVKGMKDILPQDANLYEFFESTVKSLLRAYGYQNIRTPIIEYTQLFTRGIGEATDIVEKEMYSFTDILNGKNLTLRPENTSAVIRAVIEHNMLYDGPKRLWYVGPMFRHERQQRGRYRQFHQVGVEALGFVGPDLDAEIIMMCKRLWVNLGLTGIRLEINSLGLENERMAYKFELIKFLEKHIEILDENAKRRLYTNPIRILDMKNPALQPILKIAPKLIDFLGNASLEHFDGLQRLLKLNNVQFVVNSHLVRGLDYYNRTVFEWVTDKLGAQGTIAAGGRYDPLIQNLGGKPTAACGWAMGIDRIIELLKEENLVPKQDSVDVYIIHQGKLAFEQAFIIAEQLRDIGLDVIFHCSTYGIKTSFKSQMKRADISGATYAVIFWEDEVMSGKVIVKKLHGIDLKNKSSEKTILVKNLAKYLKKLIVVSDNGRKC
ncbi:MAG: histidine--tRNA ligase [Burkholderia sp.]|nr:histidine--tRNA ligase [Burkholderia sp.]